MRIRIRKVQSLEVCGDLTVRRRVGFVNQGCMYGEGIGKLGRKVNWYG